MKYLPELERSVISTIIRYPELISGIQLPIKAISPDFVNILEVLYNRSATKQPINKMAVVSDLIELQVYEGECQSLLSGYMTFVDKDNFKNFLKKINENYKKFMAVTAIDTALKSIGNMGDITEVIAELMQAMTIVDAGNGDSSSTTLGEAAIMAIEDGIKARSGISISTGFPDLDFMTGGVKGSKLWYITARVGTGKTSAALEIALRVSMQGVPSAFISLEMKAPEIAVKKLSSFLHITRRDLSRGAFNEDDPALKAVIEKMLALPFYIEDDSYTYKRVENKIRILAKRDGVRFFVIDYLGLFPHDNLAELNKITRSFKILANELDVMIILLVQMNKVESTKRPKLIDLREIDGQDADLVLMLYQDQFDDDSPQKRDLPSGLHAVIWECVKGRTFGDLMRLKRIYDNNFDRYYTSLSDYHENSKEPFGVMALNPDLGDLDGNSASSGGQVITNSIRMNSEDIPF
jgi:replicative DNA helicase